VEEYDPTIGKLLIKNIEDTYRKHVKLDDHTYFLEVVDTAVNNFNKLRDKKNIKH
jgi:hypothetical protein